jgi:hypothetical protein
LAKNYYRIWRFFTIEFSGKFLPSLARSGMCIFSARPFPYGVGPSAFGNIFFVVLRGHRPRSYTHEPTSKVQSQYADYTPIYSPLFIKTVTLIIHHPTLRIQASLSECWIMYEINKFIFFMNNCSLNLRICKFYSTFARFLRLV